MPGATDQRRRATAPPRPASAAFDAGPTRSGCASEAVAQEPPGLHGAGRRGRARRMAHDATCGRGLLDLLRGGLGHLPRQRRGGRRIGSISSDQAGPTRGERGAPTRCRPRRRDRPHRDRYRRRAARSPVGVRRGRGLLRRIEHRLQHPLEARARDGAGGGGFVLRAAGGCRRRRGPRTAVQLVPRLHLVRRSVHREREALLRSTPGWERIGGCTVRCSTSTASPSSSRP